MVGELTFAVLKISHGLFWGQARFWIYKWAKQNVFFVLWGLDRTFLKTVIFGGSDGFIRLRYCRWIFLAIHL